MQKLIFRLKSHQGYINYHKYMYSDSGNSEYFAKKNQRRGNLANKKRFGRSAKGKSKKNDNPKSNLLMNVYDDTKEQFSKVDQSTIKPSTLFDINSLKVDLTEELPTFETEYLVVNQDSLDMAVEFCNDGLEPMVLNMASDYKPGGGVRSGKSAQEECIFRRTNAFMTHPEDWYPLESNQVIYSPEVKVIKDSDYELMDDDDHVTVSMIAVPAIRQPDLKYGTTYHDEDRYLMTSKIESIFKIALMMGRDSLVLGALGCGAFHNPPNEVSQIFKSMLNCYGKYFKRIGFAILCVKDSDSENLKAFKSIVD